jgi:hypothetical protein
MIISDWWVYKSSEGHTGHECTIQSPMHSTTTTLASSSIRLLNK